MSKKAWLLSGIALALTIGLWPEIRRYRRIRAM
jgi:hypothetical protein